MTDLNHILERLCSTSTQGLTPEQAIDDMSQIAFNTLNMNLLPASTLYTGHIVNEGLFSELSAYDEDPDGWAVMEELVQGYFRRIRDAAPFEDVLAILGAEQGGAGSEVLVNRSEDGGIELIDLSCGQGGRLLAEMRRIGASDWQRVRVIAGDIDYRMVQRVTNQIMLASLVHGIALGGVSVHKGNLMQEFGEDTLLFQVEGTAR